MSKRPPKLAWIRLGLIALVLCVTIGLAVGYVGAAPTDPAVERVWSALAELPFRPPS